VSSTGGILSKPRAYLVDDHPVVRSYLALLLETQGGVKVVGVSEDTAKARAQIAQLKPDFAIIDLTLGDGHGLDLIRDLTREVPDLKMLVFSALEEGAFARRVIQAGARGYLQKTAGPQEILQAVKKVLSGGIYLSGEMTATPKPVANSGSLEEKHDISQLSDRELQVFGMIGDGRETREIAEALKVDVKTVETYRARIKVKLRLSSANELLLAAHDWVTRRPTTEAVTHVGEVSGDSEGSKNRQGRGGKGQASR